MASKDSRDDGGVQETSLDEVEIDLEGNIKYADSAVDEVETDLDAVEVDEDGNLRIQSASKLLNESRELNRSYDTDDGLSDREKRSLDRMHRGKKHLAEEHTPEEEKEMTYLRNHRRRHSFVLAVDSSEADLNREYTGAPAARGHDLHDIELSVFKRRGSAAESAVETHSYRPTASVNSLERADNEERHDRSKPAWSRRFGSIVCSSCSNISPQKLALIIAIAVLVVGILLTVGLLPASFVYVEYHELALAKNRVSGRVNREDVYYPGCYLLTPDVELIRFQGTAHFLQLNLDIFTSDKLSFNLGISLQYFIKPEELGTLFTNYERNYRDVVKTMVISTIKNTAVKFNLDMFRLNRSVVEENLRQVVALRLSGDCCPSCCPRQCGANVDCRSCRLIPRGCSKGIHMEMRYFQMGAVDVPGEVSERFLRQTLLLLEAEKELFVQKHAVEVKKSEKMQREILNKAAEIREAATAEAKKIGSDAAANYEKQIQTSYAEAMKVVYQRLNITREDHKLSLMYVKALDDISDHLYNMNFERLSSYG